MKTNEQLIEITKNIYRELYKNSTPVGDWDTLIETAKNDVDTRFFLRYEISKELTDQIIIANFKNKRLSEWEKQKIHNTIMLGSSPMFKK